MLARIAAGNVTIARFISIVLATASCAAQAQSGTDAPQTRTAKGQQTKSLPKIKVEAQLDAEGTAAAGYLKERVTDIGPWRDRSLKDTPYAISVIPEELIQNLQAVIPDQLFKFSPTTQFAWPQSQLDYPVVYLRGFSRSTFARNGVRRDGYSTGTSTEDIASVETLTGLSGFLYGAGNVGGMVNFVSKRPTAERLNSLTVGNTSGSNLYVHGDFGGPIDSDNRFGYRINAVFQGGETFVEHQDLEKNFVSAAFDWRVNDRLLIQVDGSDRRWRLDGRQVYWSTAAGLSRPDAERLDPKKLWSQKWAYHLTESERFGANVRWQPLDSLTLRAAYLRHTDVEESRLVFNTLQSTAAYNQQIYALAPREFSIWGGYAYADLEFATGGVTHKLTTGFHTSDYTRYDHADAFSLVASFTGLPLSDPRYLNEPDSWTRPGTRPMRVTAGTDSRNWMIGDDVTFNEQWSMLAGVNCTTISLPATAGVRSYEDSATTPTAAIIYKPTEALTTYVSYMEALESGGAAADTYAGFPVVNAGEIKEPLVSDQYEIGAKLAVGNVLLTAAAFNIDKGLQYYDVSEAGRPRYVQDGRQVHRGVELTVTGRVGEQLTLFGGTTLLDANVKKNRQTPGFEGKTPPDAAEQLIKLYAEYDILAVAGLTLTGGVSHTGKVYVDGLNTDELPAYTLVDAGARYAFDLADRPVTLRLNINNLTDEIYWANSSYVGDPRTVSVSMNTQF